MRRSGDARSRQSSGSELQRSAAASEAASREAFARYLTASSRDAQWGIYCTTVGYTRPADAARYPVDPSQHPGKYLSDWSLGRTFDEYQLIYVTRGAGSFRTEGGKCYEVTAGSVMLLFPDVWHWYAPDPETGWDEYWVGFQGDYPAGLVRNGFFSPDNPVLRIGLHDSVLRIFQLLLDCARSEAPGQQRILGSHIIDLLARVSVLAQPDSRDAAEERLVEQARFLLAEHVASRLDIGWLSRTLGVGYTRLRRLFKAHTGMSPYQYFIELKIDRAKDLLSLGTLTVKEIAYMLSFDDPYHFSTLFKKKTGRPPSRWR